MHQVSANYAMPTILNTLKPVASNGVAKAVNAAVGPNGATTGNSTSSSSSSGGLDTTFLNLLAQELQNQDPTAPVDSTAMVGQMISLNQLDQLISINQTVTGSSSTGAAGLVQPAAAAAAASGTAALSSANGGVASALSPSVAGAATSQLPFDPNTMMPLGTANSGAVALSINSSLNAATMGLSGTNNNTSGGK
jgi:flagellar basal-body rod modification protein FlgD